MHSFIRITLFRSGDFFDTFKRGKLCNKRVNRRVLECHVIGLIGERLEHDFRRINQIEILSTRWAPTRHKWSYNPYKWPYKWVTGVITPLRGVIDLLITGRGPSCRNALFPYAGKWQTVEDKTPVYAIKHAGFDDRPVVGVGHIVKGNGCWQIQNSLENLRWLLIKIMDTFEVSKLVTASFRYC